MPNTFLHNLLTDLKVELIDEFDRNFERKAFFADAWPQVRIPNKRGSLLMRSGALRRSLRATVAGNAIQFTSSLPYARLQNEGGTLVVTRKMQKFFWAMYYSFAGRVTYSVKTRRAAANKRNQALTAEAAYWRAMALKKVGTRIVIRPRRFIGHHPQVDVIVRQVADRGFAELGASLKSKLKP